jgi:tetratricopeptide (TPR) repeat protein
MKTELTYPKFNDKKLFLAIANSLPTEIESVKLALQDTTNATLGIRSIFEYKEVLKIADSDMTFWKSQYYEGENHGTLPFISSYDGLKYIFDFYKRPSFQTLTNNSPVILDEHYKMLSKKMVYIILPPAYDLSGLAWRCSELEMNHNRAFLFLELYLKYYPTDPIVYMQMGETYDLIGKKEKALEYYQKGIELGYDPNENQN